MRVPLTVLYVGVSGVPTKESGEAVGEKRFSARWTGRKMPAPGMEVWK